MEKCFGAEIMRYTWEKDAKQNKPMPDGLTQSEIRAFQSLALLTARYKLGGLTAEQAVKERGDIDRAFVADSGADAANKWVVGLRKRIEIAHSRYRKERTIAAADLLSDVIDGFVREVHDA